LCVATRYRGSSCRSCLDVCPAGALVTSPWLELDAEKCTSCGACVSVCRTGALGLDLRHRALRTECYARASSDSATGEPAAVFACRRADPVVVEDATCVLSCLGGLSAGDLLAAAASRCARVDLISGDCAMCPDGPAEAALEMAVTTVDQTMAALARPLLIARRRLSGNGASAESTAPTMSRRGLLGYVARGLGQAASSAVAPRAPELSIDELHRHVAPPETHRCLILDLGELHSQSNDLVVALPASLPLAGITATSECDSCGLCLNYCPHGALAIEGRSVTCDTSSCTGCGLCAEACPRSALRIGPARLTPRRLCEAEAATPSVSR
jgi:ferredoxin